MIRTVIDFWKNSYKSDNVAFFFELISFLFIVTASVTLALNADEPNMIMVYPFFIVGNILQFYSAYRRKSAWLLLLTTYFVVINIVGLIIASKILQ